jgi:hypothetical protein
MSSSFTHTHAPARPHTVNHSNDQCFEQRDSVRLNELWNEMGDRGRDWDWVTHDPRTLLTHTVLLYATFCAAARCGNTAVAAMTRATTLPIMMPFVLQPIQW